MSCLVAHLVLDNSAAPWSSAVTMTSPGVCIQLTKQFCCSGSGQSSRACYHLESVAFLSLSAIWEVDGQPLNSVHPCQGFCSHQQQLCLSEAFALTHHKDLLQVATQTYNIILTHPLVSKNICGWYFLKVQPFDVLLLTKETSSIFRLWSMHLCFLGHLFEEEAVKSSTTDSYVCLDKNKTEKCERIIFKDVFTLIMFFDAICWILIKLIHTLIQYTSYYCTRVNNSSILYLLRQVEQFPWIFIDDDFVSLHLTLFCWTQVWIWKANEPGCSLLSLSAKTSEHHPCIYKAVAIYMGYAHV